MEKVLAVVGRCAMAPLSLMWLGKYVWWRFGRAGLLVVIKKRSLGDCHGDLQPDLFPVELYGNFLYWFQVCHY